MALRAGTRVSAVIQVCIFWSFFLANAGTIHAAVDITFSHPDDGYFLKPLYNGHDHGPSVEESIFVVNKGHTGTTLKATYGPFATQEGVASSLIDLSRVNDSHVITSVSVFDETLEVSGHVVARSLTLDSPMLQVLFHISYPIPNRRRSEPQANESTSWCADIHVEKNGVKLTSSCVLDPTDADSEVCLAQLSLPRNWWPSTALGSHSLNSVDVFYTVSGPYFDSSQCSTDANAARTIQANLPSYTSGKVFVSTVTLMHNQLTFQEVKEDQHILVYIPERSFSPGSRFRVPVKLQAESDLRLFVVKVKARHGLRLLGAEASQPDVWRITTDMNHKRRSAMVTAAVINPDSYNRVDRIQPIFEWLFEVESPDGDGSEGSSAGGPGAATGGGAGGGADDSGRIILSLEYEMTTGMQEHYGNVENRVVARLHIQHDQITTIIPVVKTTELRNTAILTGRIQNYSMRVYALSQTGTVTDVTAQTTCHSGDDDVLKVSQSCNLVYLDGTETKGSTSVSLIAKYGRHTRFLFFKVWIPAIPLVIELSDSRLSKIQNWRVPRRPYQAGRSSAATFGSMLSLGGESDFDQDDEDERGDPLCALKFQQSLVEVYAHFYVPEDSGGSQFLVHRKALMKVTDLVRDRMRIADVSIASLSGNVIEGLRPGRTELQVLSQMGRVIGVQEVKVANNKVSIEELHVDLISGLTLLIDDQTDLPDTLAVRVLKESKLVRQYQESVVDISIQYSDGTTMPLKYSAPGDFFIDADALNNHVIAFGPMLSPYQPQVIAMGEGQGRLLKIALELGDVCQRKKLKPLANNYVYVDVDFSEDTEGEQTQSDDHRGIGARRGGRRKQGGSDAAVKLGGAGVIVDNRMRGSEGVMRGGGPAIPPGDDTRRQDRAHSDISVQGGIVQGMKDETSDSPNHEAQQQRVIDSRENMSALEVGMYALLGVFCLAVVAFMANCSVFVWRYRKRHAEKWTQARGAPVQPAADWVWIGRQTLERNAVNTRCSQTLMSDADFNGNHGIQMTNTGSRISRSYSQSTNTVNRASTLPRHHGLDSSKRVDDTLAAAIAAAAASGSTADSGCGGSNRNSMVSTYKGSECSIRITANPHTDANPLLGTLAAKRAREQQQQAAAAALAQQAAARADSMRRQQPRQSRDDNANEIDEQRSQTRSPQATLADTEDTSSFLSDESTPLTGCSMPADSCTTLHNSSLPSSSSGSECSSCTSSCTESDSEDELPLHAALGASVPKGSRHSSPGATSAPVPVPKHHQQHQQPASSSAADDGATAAEGKQQQQQPLKFLNGNYPQQDRLSDGHSSDVQWDYEAMGMDYNELMDYFDNLKETSA